MENSYLSEFKNREYFNQCTNSEELEQLMNKKKIRAYIGFDCTAPSLHVGSLLQIMCLRLFQSGCFLDGLFFRYRLPSLTHPYTDPA